MSDLTTIDAIDLHDVTGGGILRSALSGALQGLSGAVQSGQKKGIWRSMLAGAVQGGAGDLAARIQGGGAQEQEAA